MTYGVAQIQDSSKAALSFIECDYTRLDTYTTSHDVCEQIRIALKNQLALLFQRLEQFRISYDCRLNHLRQCHPLFSRRPKHRPRRAMSSVHRSIEGLASK